MASADAKRCIGENARNLRRAKPHSCVEERERGRAWMRPFRRTWRAINRSLSARFDDTLTGLSDSAVGGAIPIPVDEQAAAMGRALALFRRIPTPLVPLDLLSAEPCVPCIPARRRSVRVAVVEATRRIFRGRAPPLSATCSL